MATENIYLNLTQFNNSSQSVNLEFLERRTNNILEDEYCSNWKLSVERFYINTSLIPAWLPQIESTIQNRTIYEFSMKYKDSIYTEPVIYVPEQLNVVKPDPSSNIYDSPYYHVNSRHHVVDLLNQALESCWTGIKAQAVIDGETLPNANGTAPWLIMDYTSGLLVFNSDKSNFLRTLNDPVELWVNEPLFSMMSSFEWIKDNTSTNALQYKLDIHDNHGQNEYEVSDTLTVIQSFQLYPTISQWNPVESIVLTSNNIPVKKSLIPIVNTNVNTALVGNTSEAIITDFCPDTLSEDLILSPNYPRFMDLEGETAEFKTADISVYWKDKIYGGLHRVKLPAYSKSSVLIHFARKAYSV